mgnify:CR=1 FL=1
MNEVEIYRAGGPAEEAGYARILAGPAHPPYDQFIPAPGHGLGFNDLKVIECRHLIAAMAGAPAHMIDFDKVASKSNARSTPWPKRMKSAAGSISATIDCAIAA